MLMLASWRLLPAGMTIRCLHDAEGTMNGVHLHAHAKGLEPASLLITMAIGRLQRSCEIGAS